MVSKSDEIEIRGWKIKLINHGKEDAHFELRKSFCGATQILLFVALDGWNHKEKRESRIPDKWGRSTLGKNIRISMNGPASMTFEDFEEIQQVITDCKAILKSETTSIPSVMVTDKAKPVKYDKSRGSPYDRGLADSYYRRAKWPHYYESGCFRIEITDKMSLEYAAYMAGYDDNEKDQNFKEYD